MRTPPVRSLSRRFCGPLLVASALLVAATSRAEPVFFAESSSAPVGTPTCLGSPGSYAGLDSGWVAATGGAGILFPLEGLPDGPLDAIVIGDLTVDLGQGSGVGFPTLWVLELVPNDCWSPALVDKVLLNLGGTQLSPMVFTFSTPIPAFGAHVLDDAGTDAAYRLSVTEVGGQQWNSPVVSAGNGTFIWPEGFLGVTSSVGLTEVRVVRVNTSNSGFFEVEPVLVLPSAPIPVPGIGYGTWWLLAALMLVVGSSWAVAAGPRSRAATGASAAATPARRRWSAAARLR